MSSVKKDNIITAILLCAICIISSGLIVLSNKEKPKVQVSYGLWDNKIIDISGINKAKINNTTAIIKLNMLPGIKDYNVTIENQGTLDSYVDSYSINSSIENKDITYNLNIISGYLLKSKDTKTYKLTIDNNTDKTYKNVELMLSINMINNRSNKENEFSLNNLKYNNHNIVKTNNTFTYKNEKNNYIVFGEKCYQIMEITDNNILAIYAKEYDKKCLNKKLTMKTSFNNIYKIFEEVSSSGIIVKEFEFSNEELIHLADFNINNTTSKIILADSSNSKTLDWTLIESGEFAKANDNNYYYKSERLNITPVIKIKDINTISGEGTAKNPYIIRSYVGE